jgi:hypothetical protein
MAREGGGGGGAFLWTILGIIVGVAGTLAVETLMSHHETATEQTPTSAAVAVVTPAAAPRVDPAPVAPPPSAAPAVASTDTSQLSHEDVQDDAAAAGMTSRSRTGDADSSASSPN